MQKLIYIGLLYNDESLKDAYKFSQRGVQIATHTFQKNLIDGFLEYKNIDFQVINVPPVGSFPFNYKKIFISNSCCENYKQIGFLNLPIIKKFIQKRKIYSFLKQIVNENRHNQVDVLFYSLYAPFLKVAKKIKKKYPFVSFSMIQTDAVLGRNDMEKYMTLKRKIEGNRLVKFAQCCNGFVLLSKELKKPLEIGNRPYSIVECIADVKQNACFQKNNERNICLYAGSLEKMFNIGDLATAFTFLDNAELWVCGGGEEAEFLRKLSETHTNIKFLGFLTKEEVSILQNQCDFLINPRRPSGNYTKYSFPSKTIEYIMTARPVIMYKLEAIPDEYDDYLNYMTEDNPLGIAKELKKIFEIDYNILKEKAIKGRQFVLENKGGKVQVGKILDLIKKYYN